MNRNKIASFSSMSNLACENKFVLSGRYRRKITANMAMGFAVEMMVQATVMQEDPWGDQVYEVGYQELWKKAPHLFRGEEEADLIDTLKRMVAVMHPSFFDQYSFKPGKGSRKKAQAKPEHFVWEYRSLFDDATWSPVWKRDGFIAHPDVVLQDGRILDIKCYKSLPDPDTSFQLMTYAEEFREYIGDHIPLTGYFVVQNLKSPQVHVVWQDEEFSPEQLDDVGAQINHAIGTIERLKSDNPRKNFSQCEGKYGLCSYITVCYPNKQMSSNLEETGEEI